MERTQVRGTVIRKASMAGGIVLAVLLALGIAGHDAGPRFGAAPLLREGEQGGRTAGLSEASGGTIVRINVGGTSGSGVLCAADGEKLYIVTAAHVMQEEAGARPVEIGFGDSAVLACGDYWIAKGADLAFLEIPMDELTAETARSCRLAATDKESYDGLIDGDAVLCMGCQREGELACYEGVLTDNWIYVEDFAQYMILADCQIVPGMSGGGLYDGRGRLIGIACGGNEQGELAAVPLHVAQAKFSEHYGEQCEGAFAY